MVRNIAVITAGGSGKRFKSPLKKQFSELLKRPVLCWTVEAFLHCPLIDELIITLPSEDLAAWQIRLKSEFHSPKIRLIAGGEERQHSVYNALAACSADTEFVFIHDGVRPFIKLEEIKKLYEKVKQIDAVIPAFPVKNTIKQVDADRIFKTLPRQHLIAALTPQVFRFGLIWQCHQKAREQNLIFTDDAAILEHFGFPVYWLECSAENIKITEPFDLQMAEIILKKNKRF